jgi:drug/metabolite transporter (DMT)-like permease
MSSTAIAVVVALVAAVLFGLSDVVEQRTTHEVPERAALSPRLLVDLAKRRVWVAAIAVNVLGNILQIVALHFGALALVQPILVCDLLFAAVFAAALAHRRPDRIMAAGVICCAAGVAGFLAIARPHGGRTTTSFTTFLPLALALAALVIGCLAAAHWGSRRARPLWLALACGVDFGVNAFLLKVAPATLPQGFSDPLKQWPLYALVVTAPTGFLLNQNAFQAGTLIAPVLAIITTVDPLLSIGVAHAWLGETITSTPLALAGEIIALIIMTAGIVALAQRSPHVMSRNPDLSGTADPGMTPGSVESPLLGSAPGGEPDGKAVPGPDQRDVEVEHVDEPEFGSAQSGISRPVPCSSTQAHWPSASPASSRCMAGVFPRTVIIWSAPSRASTRATDRCGPSRTRLPPRSVSVLAASTSVRIEAESANRKPEASTVSCRVPPASCPAISASS